jgi:hypothetical protein
MASIDNLPPDQRAVLQLVLQRGRSYDDIAGLLSIDRAAVRQRAHAALDALGPGTRVDPERRAQVADYLLSQQTEAEAAQTREHLASSAGERAWARVVASELSPLASAGLPEIPAEGAPDVQPPPVEPVPVPPTPAARLPPPPAPDQPDAPQEPAAPRGSRRARAPRPEPAFDEFPDERTRGDRPVSRRGGATLIAVAVVVIVVIVIVVASGGGGSSKHSTTNAGGGSTTAPAGTTGLTGATGATASTGPTGTTGPSAKPIAQFNLTSPTSKKTVGIAQLLKAGTQFGIAIVAENVPANTKKNAYAVWLYNSPGHAELLGFVNPGVGSTGRLSTAGPLPANASQYHNLLVTVETQDKPKSPGTIVLQGQVKLTTS